MSYSDGEVPLPSLWESAKGGVPASHAVLKRLQFLARVLRRVPATHGEGPWLLWFAENGQLASVRVSAPGVVVGRDPTCDIMLPGNRVSRRHCVVRPGSRREVEVEDLGSSNGTRVNGRDIPAHNATVVQDGAVIEVGGQAIAILAGGESEETSAGATNFQSGA